MKKFLLALYIICCIWTVLNADMPNTVLDVDFDQAMGVDRLGADFICGRSRDEERFTLFKQVWNKNRPASALPSEKAKIPEIIHQIWLEERAVPKKFRKNQQSWIKNHPRWKYMLWTTQDLQKLPPELEAYIKQAECLQEKEDLLRIYLLRTVGGVVIDMNFQNLVPFDDLHRRYAFYAALEPPLPKAHFSRRLHVGTSFIGAIAGHPIIDAWWEEIVALKSTASHEESSIERTIRRPQKRGWLTYLLFGRAVDLHLDSERYCNSIFPPTYAYPLSPRWAHGFIKRERKAKANAELWKDQFWNKITWKQPPLFSEPQPESIAMHMKGGTWADAKQVKHNGNYSGHLTHCRRAASDNLFYQSAQAQLPRLLSSPIGKTSYPSRSVGTASYDLNSYPKRELT